ncbi:uncharacterized protein STEHIDRAFT_167095 [Stereum hirsutum FP-91666 SS1]|uniref:uncharacterized protein n=1 Tax=Stereum hirsutum (strain FP-91666) TaxID=721885 RepID=UPI000440A3CD|nr:uncharacterized protein STEHIDRAFT_167095 [Stereum hirsutum FP-91666 SS1]EIM89228.1 hypothetical protein STEHIDRAFT_167095 [Stereum hirsutum FP-91666 SS1]
MLPCPACDTSFGSPDELQRHTDLNHLWVCFNCGGTFPSENMRKRHQADTRHGVYVAISTITVVVDPSSSLDLDNIGVRPTSTVQGPLSLPDFPFDQEADISDASLPPIHLSDSTGNDVVRYYPPPTPTISYPPPPPPPPPPQSDISHGLNLTESEHANGPPTEHRLVSAYLAFFSAMHFVFKTFTYHTELNSAQHSHAYEEILKKSLVEWYTVGAFLLGNAAIDATVFGFSAGSSTLFTVDGLAKDAVAASSVSCGLGIILDACFLFKYGHSNGHDFARLSKDINGSFLLFCITSRLPTALLLLSGFCTSLFLIVVAWTVSPATVGLLVMLELEDDASLIGSCSFEMA